MADEALNLSLRKCQSHIANLDVLCWACGYKMSRGTGHFLLWESEGVWLSLLRQEELKWQQGLELRLGTETEVSPEAGGGRASFLTEGWHQRCGPAGQSLPLSAGDLAPERIYNICIANQHLTILTSHPVMLVIES